MSSSEALIPTQKQSIPRRGRSHSHSHHHQITHSPSESFSSLYGHPAATRASLVQTAHDIASARSPSPPPRNSSNLPRHSIDSLVSPTIIPQPTPSIPTVTGSPVPLTEDTPLLRDAHNHRAKHGHSHGSMNMRALVLHVLGDALGNVGVIATGLILWQTTWKYKYYCDPVISLVITIIIFSSALPLGLLAHTSLFIVY
jgi:zinc transporter 1